MTDETWKPADAGRDLDKTTSFASRRVRRISRGSLRIRRTTLIFRTLLLVAMIVALAATLLGASDKNTSDPTSPDAAPPAVFVFPED